MASCGKCGGGIGNTLVKHGEICEDDSKATPQAYAPELDDVIKLIEEGQGYDYTE